MQLKLIIRIPMTSRAYSSYVHTAICRADSKPFQWCSKRGWRQHDVNYPVFSSRSFTHPEEKCLHPSRVLAALFFHEGVQHVLSRYPRVGHAFVATQHPDENIRKTVLGLKIYSNSHVKCENKSLVFTLSCNWTTSKLCVNKLASCSFSRQA